MLQQPFESWEEELDEDIQSNLQELANIIVTSRDWTVETIVNQIKKGNIDLNPKFQRRNAWDDARRSRLIESLIIGMPVPEIVLAENPVEKGAFIVIDGKQRLTSIVGFINADVSEQQYWEKPKLKGLKTRKDLNGITFSDLEKKSKYSSELIRFFNHDIRCTIITGLKSQDVLYDIFYRLNTNSVPLSTQELRQVLNKGLFADYLVKITSTKQPLHKVIGLQGPDNRLKDAELILRFIAFYLFGKKYKSNLRKFLDEAMKEINNQWGKYEVKVTDIYRKFNETIHLLESVFEPQNIGRKYTDGKWDKNFNRVLFEVEVYYFMHLLNQHITKAEKEKFIEEFKELCGQNSEFRRSIEASTKDTGQYAIRFRKFLTIVNKAFNTHIDDIPV
jgi:uncharacterized protein with ParB-like and HNH nuclease domain